MISEEYARKCKELNELCIEGYICSHMLSYDKSHYFITMPKEGKNVGLRPIDILNEATVPDSIVINGDIDYVYAAAKLIKRFDV